MEAEMHSHVERCTTDKLQQTLDDAYESAAAHELVSVEKWFIGGRDWVVVTIHHDHAGGQPAPAPVQPPYIWPGVNPNWTPQPNYPQWWAGATTTATNIPFTASGPTAVQADTAGGRVGPIKVEMYDDAYAIGPEGEKLPMEWAGLVQDVNETWIMYFDAQARPRAMWLKRMEDGAVVGPEILSSIPVDDSSTDA